MGVGRGVGVARHVGAYAAASTAHTPPRPQGMVKVTLVHSRKELFSRTNEPLVDGYERSISEWAKGHLQRAGVQLMESATCVGWVGELPARSVGAGLAPATTLRPPRSVTHVTAGSVGVEGAQGAAELEAGTCVWATGLAPHPLVSDLKRRLPHSGKQTARRALLVDEHLVVRGSGGRIFALGDAATNADDPASALPATAQVARQQGEYLAALLNQRQ